MSPGGGKEVDLHELDPHVAPSDAELEATLAKEHPPLPAPGTNRASCSSSPANRRVSTMIPSWSSPRPSSRSEQIIPAETCP